jgi:hypothetical protein
MSDCCLPNLGCLSIPVVSTNVAGNPGQNGAPGNGIASESYDPLTGELTLTFTDSTTFTTGDLRGAAGAAGGAGVNGVSRLYTNFSPLTSITTQAWQQMDTYTLAANSLVNIGDSVILQFEMELLLKNIKFTNPISGVTTVLNPYRRVSIASGATSLTLFDTASPLGEPYMTTLSVGSIPTQTFVYRTTVELTKTAASSVAGNFKSRTRWDGSIPSGTYTNNSIAAFNIDIANPIVFSLDIYQWQATEVRKISLTIDKITAQ